MRIHFLTPTRLVDKDQLVKQPPFTVFFRRMLERIDALAGQYAGAGRRPPEQVRQLYDLAEEVNTTQANLTWTDLWGPSSRTGRVTPMGGFTGSAVYRAQDWSPLLPWLLLGQGAQVGKLAAKGNGVFELDLPGRPAYWQFCFSQVEGQIH